MKQKIKDINWKNVGWRSLQALIVAILNTPLWVMLIGNFVGSTKWYRQEGDKIITKIDYWFSDLSTSDQIIIVLFILVGIILSIIFTKFLYKQYRDDKRIKKQTKELKDATREQKDINKYL